MIHCKGVYQYRAFEGEKMYQLKLGTVKETGAKSGSILIGIDEKPLNSGLCIKVHTGQPQGYDGRIKGSFDLILAGHCKYSDYFGEHEGRTFSNAGELLCMIQDKGGAAQQCKHLLDCGRLRNNSYEGIISEQDIDELLNFLPRFKNATGDFIKKWNFDSLFPYPDYNEDSDKFFRFLQMSKWMDCYHIPEELHEIIEDVHSIEKADIATIRRLLTYCVRGERFCDGFFGVMLRDGKITAILKRLQTLRDSI